MLTVCLAEIGTGFIEAGVFGNVGAVDLVLGNIGFLAFGVQPFLQVQAQFLGAVAGQGRNAVYRAGPAQGCAQLLLDLFGVRNRSEEHTSELQSLMRISYAVFCLKKKTITT